MTKQELIQKWKYFDSLSEEEFEKFEDRVTFTRSDLHGMELLQSLRDNKNHPYLLLVANPGKIYFSPLINEIAKNITEEQIFVLWCCGISVDEHLQRFYMTLL